MADDFSVGAPAIDLLGDPYRPLPDKRGRRKLRYDPQVYDLVEAYAADGMSQDDIAAALTISPKTLRANFSRELAAGPARRRAELLAALADKAKAGNMAAIKLSLERIEKAERRTARPFAGQAKPSPSAEAPLPSPKVTPLGKKESLVKRAGEPPRGWAGRLQH